MNTKHDQGESNWQIFWDIIESIQIKYNSEHWLGISIRTSQVNKDRIVNTVIHTTFLQLFYAWSVCFLSTVNHVIAEMLFDTWCYYFSAVQSLLFCSRTHMRKQTNDIGQSN